MVRIVLVAGLFSRVAAAGTQSAEGSIVQTWKPVRHDAEQVETLVVRTEMDALGEAFAASFSLKVPIVYAGVTGIAERTSALRIEDAEGDVPVQIVDDEPISGGFPYYRHFRATRTVRWPVVATYEAGTPGTLMRAPPFGLYAAHGGVSGSPRGFLLMPETDQPLAHRLHWDLSDLAPGSEGAISFGDGDVTFHGTAEAFADCWLMAGPLGRYPAHGGADGFSAVWLGTPAFDPGVEMAWATRMYEWLGRSYGYLRPLPPYRVFLRVDGRSGTALGASFMAGVAALADGASPSAPDPALRETFTHEMGHLFVGELEEPVGTRSWFSEGLNTYYTRLLPMRGGFTSVDDYVRQVNADFSAYWNSPGRNFSAAEITRVGFGDETVRRVPYKRGSLYFADLDVRIRAHSGGRRTLDEVLRETFERRDRGERIDHDAWRTLVEREAGPGAAAYFDALVLDGTETIVPASDAFGPFLERRSTPETTVDGVRRAAGFEWVRLPAMSEAECRAWGEPPTPPELAGRKPSMSKAEHSGTFGGTPVRYRSVVEEFVLTAPDGVPDASLVTIAYLRDDVADPARRPVLFAFNGGPGASSSPLHMNGLGPRLRNGEAIDPNPDSILDAVDLVFIDPVGTGFSRPFTTEAGRRRYWTRSGDAASVAEVIRRWLRAHDRESSPRYLAGESYGTIRAALIVTGQEDLRFDGVLLVAVVVGELHTGEELGSDEVQVDQLPTMAAAAWHHGVGLPASMTVEAVFEEAARFATGDYRAALAQGERLDEDTRARVAARVEALVGLPGSFVASHDLRFTRDEWMRQVLATRDLRTGMLDARVTSPLDPASRGDLADPSLNAGTLRFGTEMLAPARLPAEGPDLGMNPSTLHTYLTGELGFPTIETYRSLNLDINPIWDHEGMGDVLPALAARMRDDPDLRLFWTGGYFDLTTPANAVRRAFAELGMPAERTTGAIVPAAHAVFGEPGSRTELADRLRAWLR